MTDTVNPYIAGSPVTGKEMFFGRQDIFNFVRQTLTGRHRDQIIVLYGQRRTGKTSILYQMHRHLDARYLCIFVDLHGLSMNSEATFLWELANYVRRVLRRQYQIELPQPDREAFLADARGTFANDFLDRAWQAVGDRHILLMLDEAVRLQEQVQAGRLDKAIFEYLRHLMQHYERLNFLFSLGSGLEEMEKEYAFLFNVALYKKISFLEREAAVELITRPVQAYYEIETAVVERILAITSCHPYYTQLLCHSLFNRWQQQGGNVITVNDVDTILEEVVERGLAVLKHTWEESAPGEKAVLAGLAAAMGEQNRPLDMAEVANVWASLDVTIPADETARAMKSLIARDIVRGEREFKFAVDLQHLWVRKYERLEWVREEIRDHIEGWRAAVSVAPAPPVVEAEEERPHKRDALIRLPASNRAWLALVGATVLVVLLLFAAVQLIDNDSEPASGASVALGGSAALVNDLALAGDVVWAATEGGLVRWSADGQWTQISGPDIGFSDDWNQTIVAAPDGSLWIGGGGVSHVEPGEDGVRFLTFYDRDDNLGLTTLRTLMVDHDGTIWAGGTFDRESPLSWFDGQEWHPDVLPLAELVEAGLELEVWSLLRSTDGSLWIGLRNDGILRWDGQNWTHWQPDIWTPTVGSDSQDDRIRALLQDDSGVIWAAASNRGLLRYRPTLDNWEQVIVVEQNEPVSAIAQFADSMLWTGGDYWVAHSEDGGDSWTLAGTAEDGLGSGINSLVQDPEGRVWIGDHGEGVSVLENGRWRHLQR